MGWTEGDTANRQEGVSGGAVNLSCGDRGSPGGGDGGGGDSGLGTSRGSSRGLGSRGRRASLDLWILVGTLVAAGAAVALWRGLGGRGSVGDGAHVVAEIRVEGRLLGVWRLDTAGEAGESTSDRPRFVAVPGPLGNTRVELGRGRVRVVSSPCPDKICVRTGWKGSPGEVIACLPNRVLVTVRAVPVRDATDEPTTGRVGSRSHQDVQDL